MRVENGAPMRAWCSAAGVPSDRVFSVGTDMAFCSSTPTGTTGEFCPILGIINREGNEAACTEGECKAIKIRDTVAIPIET